jgi:deazaflavin-dependent oxidoreductase (nitroreductase family)
MAESDRRKMRLQWKMHKLIWNVSGGRLGRTVVGMPVAQLETIGWKSGEPRQILITYVDSDGAPAIVGTNAGRDVDPGWVRNLRTNPDARARWDGQWHDVVGVEFDGDNDQAAWDAAVAANAGYTDYLKILTRPIAIIRLDPR